MASGNPTTSGIPLGPLRGAHLAYGSWCGAAPWRRLVCAHRETDAYFTPCVYSLKMLRDEGMARLSCCFNVSSTINTSLASQNRITVLKVVSCQPLQTTTSKMAALTLAQQCTCRSKQFKNPTRSRRDIQANFFFKADFWRHFWPKIRMTAPKIVVPDHGEIWCTS